MQELLLEIKGIVKSFSGVRVLSDVDFELRRGEVHAIVGENGAGKSTFIKILSGAYERDSGEIRLRGEPVGGLTPKKSHDLGIVAIYQERNLVPFLSVGENILIGNVPRSRLGVVRWKELFRRAMEILENLGLKVNPQDIVAALGSAEQQAVEIAKALYKEAGIVIMDEPTASLTRPEIDNLFRLIGQLKSRGVSVIYISHRLDEIFTIADRVTVLRDGRRVLTSGIDEIGKGELVKAMVGEELALTRIGDRAAGETVFEARGISKQGFFNDASLEIHRGEIVGIAGMVGAGRTGLVRALAGIDRVDGGKILLRREEIQGKPLEEFIKRGICFLPENRDLIGLISVMSVAGNITLASMKKISKGPFLSLPYERELAGLFARTLSIQAKGISQEVMYLSGGNRQKVMLAKWLCLGIEIFIMDEPTQGVDVGAREEIHRIMTHLLQEGKSILMVSSDLDELMNMSHRVLVMKEGRIVGDLVTSQSTREEVLSLAIGKPVEKR
jgi:ribose transport system ATP-binding protein